MAASTMALKKEMRLMVESSSTTRREWRLYDVNGRLTAKSEGPGDGMDASDSVTSPEAASHRTPRTHRRCSSMEGPPGGPAPRARGRRDRDGATAARPIRWHGSA